MRDDRAPAIGLALLILVTATLFGVAPRVIDRVGDDALHGVVAQASALNRNIALLEEQPQSPDKADPLKHVNEEGDRLDQKIPASVLAIFRERQTVVDSARLHVEAATPDPSFIRFRIQPGADERIRYVSGKAPAAIQEMVDLPQDLQHLLPVDSETPKPVRIPVLEAAISTEGAAALVRHVGDRVFLSLDSRDPLSSRQPGVVAMRISGIYDVIDPGDPF